TKVTPMVVHRFALRKSTPPFQAGHDSDVSVSPSLMSNSRLFRRIILGDPRSVENRSYHRVPLVTPPLVHWPSRLRHWNLGRPGLIPGSGVFYCEPIRDRVIGGAREALHQVQVLTGPAEGGQVGEICGVDH